MLVYLDRIYIGYNYWSKDNIGDLGDYFFKICY